MTGRLVAAQDRFDPAESLSADELHSVQLERLRWTLQHAYENVPFYRRRFDEAGVRPEDCRQLEDITAYPFTTKADLRADYPFGMFAVPRSELRRIHASSGTTGEPTVVGYTADDLVTWSGLVARCIHAAGGRPGDIVHVSYGYGLFTGGLGAHYGAERLGCVVVPASGGMTARQVRLITDFRPTVIMATPSYMLTLIEEFERQGIDPRTSSLRVGVLGAEPWTEEMRREIEERMDMDALDTYGLSEVIGPGVAQECRESKDGPHIWEDHFLPETVDPDSGTPLAPGEHGELVFTSLTKQAFPVIRYRTRDLTSLLPGTARPAFRRISRVAGRSDDMIVLRGVNLFPSQIEELLLRSSALAPHFQLVRSRRGHLDVLTVRAERRSDVTGDRAAAAADELTAAIRASIGVGVGVQIVEPGHIERSEGKARRVIDERS
jgi:phenylacetate-CoA ligase